MRRRASSDWSRRYPPLAGFAVAAALAAFVLPSSLNTPQTNPTETVEYAPVPPSDDDPPPPAGNTDSLGLGSSGSIDGDGLGGDGPGLPPPVGPPDGSGTIPRTKRCVGKPPRQTDDPMSPPCVAHFEGDNFGATYAGVTGSEVRILFYFDGNTNDAVTSRGQETRPSNALIDLGKPATDDEHVFVRVLRDYQRYFNERYQTYQRFVRFFVYFDPSGTATPESRRADAIANVKAVRPFAVLSYPSSLQAPYLEEMARRGVLNFGSAVVQRADYFRRFPGRIWSYLGSLDEQARIFSDAVCAQIVPFRTSRSGNAGQNGTPRKLALLKTSYDDVPEWGIYADLVKKRVQACGGNFVAEGTYPFAGWCKGINTATGENNTSAAAANMSTFAQKGVTTIIWPTGHDATHSRAAAQAQYRPEWVLAGDSRTDNFWSGQCQDQDTWHGHAMVVTPAARERATADTECYKATLEANPEQADAGFICGFRPFYVDLRQLFTGVQVAGPRLTPQSVDQGFHAIPPYDSTSPYTPACYYGPGDYTCVKDAALMWWDRNGDDPNADQPGCWCMVAGGRRWGRRWPSRDMGSGWTPGDPCSGYAGAGLYP